MWEGARALLGRAASLLLPTAPLARPTVRKKHVVCQQDGVGER